jgi:hypothetical protein
MPVTPSYGRSAACVELTDEILDQMAEEAEEGLDVTRLRRRPEERDERGLTEPSSADAGI